MADVYEWIPTSIVVGTFVIGLVSESVEARRFRGLHARLTGSQAG